MKHVGSMEADFGGTEIYGPLSGMIFRNLIYFLIGKYYL